MRKNAVTVIFIISLAAIFWAWLLPLFPNVGPDLSSNFQAFTHGLPLPWIWANTLTGDGQGIYSAVSLWTYPSQAIYQLFLTAGIPFWFQMKYLAFLPMLVIAIVGMAKVSRHFGGDWRLASLVYVANNYFLTLIDGGQLNLGIAYALLPLSFALFLNRRTLLFVLSVWLIGCFDFRLVVIELVLIAFYLLLHPESLKKALQLLLLLGIILPLLNAYWLLPALFARFDIFSSGYGSVAQLDQFSFASLKHVLFFQSPHWFHNDFGRIEPVRWYFVALPLLAFLPALFHRSKHTLFLIGLLLTGIILAKGTQPPFSFIYYFLYQIIPLFKVFRDPSKFYILIFFAAALLISRAPRRLAIPILVLITLMAYPAITGRLTGTFSPPLYQSEHAQLQQILSADQNFSRTFWIPAKPPLGYVSTTHPALEAQWTTSKRPFFTNITGTYELFNYLRSPAIASLLDISSVKYLFYPTTDQRKHALKPDEIAYENWFRDYSSNQTWLQPLPLSDLGGFKTVQTSPRFYTVNTLLWVVGPDDTYDQLARLGVPLHDVGVIHVNEQSQVLSQLKNLPDLDNRLVLNHTTPLDMTLAGLSPEELISPAKNIRSDGSDPSGWWSRGQDKFLDLREILLTKYAIPFHDFDLNQGYALSEGSHTLKLHLPAGELFARVLESTASGQLTFVSPSLQTVLTTTSLDPALRWQHVGKLPTSTEVEVTSSGQVNLINALAVVSDERLADLNREAADILKKYPPTDVSQLLSHPLRTQQPVKNTFVTPTKHELTNVSGPSLLIFTDNYHPGWQLQTPDHKPVSSSRMIYSLTNGFYIPKTQDYEVYFVPQDLVHTGLLISTITFGLCLLLIIKKV